MVEPFVDFDDVATGQRLRDFPNVFVGAHAADQIIGGEEIHGPLKDHRVIGIHLATHPTS